MDPRTHNRAAWKKKADDRDRWTVPVDSETIEQARRGQFSHDAITADSWLIPSKWSGDEPGQFVVFSLGVALITSRFRQHRPENFWINRLVQKPNTTIGQDHVCSARMMAGNAWL
jgi:hypothetical protein